MNKLTCLEFVNGIRRQLDLEPIDELQKGRRDTALECPISNSIKYGFEGTVCTNTKIVLVQDKRISDEKDNRFISTHKFTVLPEITDFIVAFDGGAYPEYERQVDD